MAKAKISSIKNASNTEFTYDIAIVGGLGHVGLPLGLAFANVGLNVLLCDLDAKKAKTVSAGEMPFVEYGADEILKRVINKNLNISLDNSDIAKAKYVILTIGTPVDEYLNPKLRTFLDLAATLKPHLNPEQTIIVRSTVFPKTCGQLLKFLGAQKKWKIAYCPERIAQGYAVKELAELPQIVAGLSEIAVESAVELFKKISPLVLRASIEEAELVKLFSNAWRYIQFAAANQFYMISKQFGADFSRVRHLMTEGYGRAASLPKAGFAAGPCLLKDTMQLAAFNNNHFELGYAAMTVNEGLPGFVVEELKKKYVLEVSKVGILGMAFKGDVDDIRDSLSYKLGKILRFNGANVSYSDEFAQNSTFVSKEEILATCNIVIIAAPHSAYKNLSFSPFVEVVDLFGICENKNAQAKRVSGSADLVGVESPQVPSR
ncbi:MAG: nucleotide sugar dehydrogenase [Bacteriovoracaceae bacterium]|nr:nucleotide sugar dehydrogenase [Bacteriovoracaceae bacterium]